MKRLALVLAAFAGLASASVRAQDAARLLKTAMDTEMVDGDLKSAIHQFPLRGSTTTVPGPSVGIVPRTEPLGPKQRT